MNKRYYVFLLVLLTLFCTIMASCSEKQNGIESTSNSGNSGSYQRAGLMGEVSDITGNDVTVKVIKAPTFTGSSGSSNNWSSGFNRSSRSRSGTSGSSWSRSGSGIGSSKRSLQYTGAVKDVVIPVGVNIVETSRGQSGASQVTVSLTSIVKGDILSFYYASDGKTIEKVSLSNSSSGIGSYSGGASNGSSN